MHNKHRLTIIVQLYIGYCKLYQVTDHPTFEILYLFTNNLYAICIHFYYKSHYLYNYS